MSSPKIAVFGKCGVGKSCLLIKFIQNIFLERYDPTAGDSFTKTVKIEGKSLLLELFDTADAESFVIAMQQYLIETADGFLLVYSCTDRASFDEELDTQRRAIAEHLGHQISPVILVGNKCDLLEQRVVSPTEGLAKAQQWGCPFYETSAKYGTNVELVFMQLAQQIYARLPPTPARRGCNFL